MKKVQDLAIILFLVSVVVLTGVSVFGVWDVFGKDVLVKSFQTFGVLAFVMVIVVIAIHFSEKKGGEAINTVETPNPIFTIVRKSTVGVLIALVSLLALIGVLSIWEVIADKDVLYKSISSISLLAFSSLVIITTCLQREENSALKNTNISSGMVIAAIIFIWMFFTFAEFNSY